MARTFRIEPAGLLTDDGDEWPMLVNLAAARYIAREEKAEQERSERSRKSGRGGGSSNYRRPSGAGRRPSTARRR